MGSGNGFVPSDNKPLPETMLTEICLHMAALGHNELTSLLFWKILIPEMDVSPTCSWWPWPSNQCQVRSRWLVTCLCSWTLWMAHCCYTVKIQPCYDSASPPSSMLHAISNKCFQLVGKWINKYSVHKKYGNSNSYANINTNIFIIHNFINTANWKYPFPSPYQISDTFVKYFGSYGH